MSSSISWQAYEYNHTPKTSDWYWAIGIISLSLATLCAIYGNFLLGLIIVIGATALAIHASKAPRIVGFEINEKGVVIDDVFYPYSNLDSFSIETHEVENHSVSKVLIKSKKIFMPLLVMPIADVGVDKIQEYLLIFLPQEEHRESLEERMLEYLGF